MKRGTKVNIVAVVLLVAGTWQIASWLLDIIFWTFGW